MSGLARHREVGEVTCSPREQPRAQERRARRARPGAGCLSQGARLRSRPHVVSRLGPQQDTSMVPRHRLHRPAPSIAAIHGHMEFSTPCAWDCVSPNDSNFSNTEINSSFLLTILKALLTTVLERRDNLFVQSVTDKTGGSR